MLTLTPQPAAATRLAQTPQRSAGKPTQATMRHQRVFDHADWEPIPRVLECTDGAIPIEESRPMVWKVPLKMARSPQVHSHFIVRVRRRHARRPVELIVEVKWLRTPKTAKDQKGDDGQLLNPRRQQPRHTPLAFAERLQGLVKGNPDLNEKISPAVNELNRPIRKQEAAHDRVFIREAAKARRESGRQHLAAA